MRREGRGGEMLTDEQCNEFRRLPGSFNDMVRAIHEAGRQQMKEEAARVVESIYSNNESEDAMQVKIVAAIRAL